MKKEDLKKFCAPIFINNRKLAFWDYELRKKNLDFINQIDPEYFKFVAKTNFNILNDEEVDKREKQYAAMNLNAAYSQGLEALFSLLFATLQAPYCVIGWILKYENNDLKEIVEKFSNGQEIITNFYEKQEIVEKLPDGNEVVTEHYEKIETWENVANLIFSFSDKELSINYSNKIRGFAELWRRFAKDFLSKRNKDEYNSIKHGLRLGMKGHQFFLGPSNSHKIPFEQQQWEMVSDSNYGSSFYGIEKIDKTNFILKNCKRNWNPEKFFHALNLISDSIKIVILSLNKLNGNQVDLEFVFPQDEYFFERPWLFNEYFESNRKSGIIKENLPLLTEEDIDLAYQKLE